MIAVGAFNQEKVLCDRETSIFVKVLFQLYSTRLHTTPSNNNLPPPYINWLSRAELISDRGDRLCGHRTQSQERLSKQFADFTIPPLPLLLQTRSGPISAGLVITEHTSESQSLLSTLIMGGKYRDIRYANFEKLRQFHPLWWKWYANFLFWYFDMTERDEKRMQMWKIFRTHSVKIFVTIDKLRPKPKSRKKLCKINVSNQQDCQWKHKHRKDWQILCNLFFTKTINKLIFPEFT